MGGTLYVVATPIGNLEDISARALRVLREVDLIAAEDTRTTRKLLAHFDIHTPLTSYHSHTGERKTGTLVERLSAGESVALTSDAGTPGISDPGGELVRAAVEAGIRVEPIPGASALIAALCASGLDPSRLVFEGFLPRSRGDIRAVLQPLRALPHTLVFYEAPGRVADTLRRLSETLGNRPAVVARELTKKFEEFAHGTLEELEERFRSAPPRGECVILVAGSSGVVEESAAASPEARARDLLARGVTVRDAAKLLATECRLPRREAYALVQRLAEPIRPPGARDGLGEGDGPAGPA